MKKFLLFLIALAAGGVLLLMLLSADTALTLEPGLRVIAEATPFTVRAENPHGVRRITVAIEQNGNRYRLLETSEPAHRFRFLWRHEPARVVEFTAGKQRVPELRDGQATLIVEATANDLRARTARLERAVQVNTRPPEVVADGFQHYVNQGGAELVTFKVSGYWTEAGVRVGSVTFRSFPLPGRPKDERFALFALPWNAPADVVPVVYARNPSGTEATAHFSCKVFPKRFRTRPIELDDAFMQKAVSEIDPGGSGDLLTRFLKINRDLRRENNKTLADLRLKTEERVLWSGPFLRYGKTESAFADTRDYMYHGEAVDRETHLGFDLADVAHAPIRAANDGKVIWAARLGIYGNCIVIDHGYGLQSIYGHLSEFLVKPGEMVKKGQVIGRSGQTGLAAGDHLHFSMQVDGVQTTPTEWWDEHWIQDRILSKLPGRG